VGRLPRSAERVCTSSGGGQWKISDNTIEEFRADGSRVVRFQPVPAFQTAESMGRMYEGFRRVWTEDRIDKLVLTAAFVLGFLCIHPFSDGNGRMARLLTLLLLCRAGYTVGRYISLERLIEQSKETYYEALHDSSQSWHEGQHDLRPWLNYFLGIVLAAYREFEDRVGEFVSGRGTKSEMVRTTIHHMSTDFSARDIQTACPNVGIDLIRRILREERVAGRVECLGRGPDARWRVVTTK
jgi:Fic family protein